MVRVSKAKVAEHRSAILESASRLFRERGFNDVGVAEIMQASGLTHGAFYGHFRSKADLAGAACREACAEGVDNWKHSGDIATILDRYLSIAHRDNPARGCALGAFAGDIARQGPELQHDYAEAIERFRGVIEQHLTDNEPEVRRRKATTILATMVGALTMARGIATADPALSAAILDDVRLQLRACFGV
ncbi:TetR/AcrR family transcriptional repressor of nem operon [Angulomicrobium tetraedrale]|uniref:TetR/AcrR family transcriptional repressor of nem operon n=1 Tax=Ancylobacter tetraedralis TaxID=217068 RepID=A0A839ZFI9_9HYPH|nr:TetR family transcriptional regulator [Ancylobacter tetraedralis]MBB3773365.1 TetR/AcrR family transcriptional repressor of nem operon [Ancylobacter tetraedralis]